jgi:hypothetical protein
MLTHVLCVLPPSTPPQGLAAMKAGETPLPEAAAAMDSATQMLLAVTNWTSWLGGGGGGAATAGGAAGGAGGGGEAGDAAAAGAGQKLAGTESGNGSLQTQHSISSSKAGEQQS